MTVLDTLRGILEELERRRAYGEAIAWRVECAIGHECSSIEEARRRVRRALRHAERRGWIELARQNRTAV